MSLDSEKIDCYPDNSPENKQNCEERGCLWEPVNRI